MITSKEHMCVETVNVNFPLITILDTLVILICIKLIAIINIIVIYVCWLVQCVLFVTHNHSSCASVMRSSFKIKYESPDYTLISGDKKHSNLI